MINEGQITIDCTLENEAITEVNLSSTRPLQLTQKLVGSSIDFFLETIPRVFSICGIAQVVAAQRALSNQSETSIPVKLYRSQELLVQLETIREQLFRIGSQWPKLFALPMSNIDFKSFNQIFTRIKSALFCTDGQWHWNELNTVTNSELSSDMKKVVHIVESQLFNDSMAEWLALETRSDLTAWCKTNPCLISSALTQIMQSHDLAITTETPSLEALVPSNRELVALFKASSSSDFIQTPQWRKLCCETGPASRMAHPLLITLSNKPEESLLRRYVARLLELALNTKNLMQLITWDEKGWDEKGQEQIHLDGTGVAQVKAARGRLVHYAQVRDDIVIDYKILAPTEWNFHPHGLVSEGLKSLTADDSSKLEQYSRWFIESIDPCVAYQLRMH